MKKFIFLFILININLFASNMLDDVFQKASESYENKDFAQSLQQFLSIENEGIINADLYYNIGNCYFRLNQVGKAVLYFKKALKVDSHHRAAERNLKFVLTFTKDKQVNEETDFLSTFGKKIFSFFTLNSLSAISLVFFIAIIFMINIIILKFRNREKTVPIFIISILTILLIISGVLSFLKFNSYQQENQAVLISSTAIGYSGPNEEFTRVFTIHEGMVFEIEKQENDWSLIKLPNGLGGWIPTETYERITLSLPNKY